MTDRSPNYRSVGCRDLLAACLHSPSTAAACLSAQTHLARTWPPPAQPGPLPMRAPLPPSLLPQGKSKLLTANAGDARILLVRGNKAIQLTEDHVPGGHCCCV